ncbi:MAG: hypothetical protein GF398_01195 [Chitinivibrionales bacterium]|nr:hypothetical protein [Chitinivibrionales bacterium]
MNKQIVITGYESISALGLSWQQLCENLGSAVTPGFAGEFEFHAFDAALPCFRISGLEPKEVLGRKGLRTKDWATKLLLCVLENGFSGLFAKAPAHDRPGLCLGTSFGSVQSIGDFLSDSIENGVNSVNPQAFANTVINSPISNANIRYGISSLSTTVSTGFNSSLDALCYACDYLQQGYLDWIIAGGVEEISYYELLGFERSGQLSASGSIQPHGKSADGLIPGEACGMLLLETAEHASARNANVIAEVCAVSTGFAPIAAEAADVLAHTMHTALSDASLSASQLAFAATSANGVAAGDEIIAHALRDTAPHLPVTAYKRHFGECYGASDILSAMCALADLQNNRITGVGTDYEAVENLNLVTGNVQADSSPYALLLSSSCDGNCGSFILKNV